MTDKRLPWNTGKVQIGLHYEPPTRKVVMSRDEENLQSFLLGKQSSRVPVEALVAIAISMTIFAVLMIWVP